MGGFELTPPRPGRIPRIASKHGPSRVSESTGCSDLWEQMGIDWGAVPRIPSVRQFPSFGELWENGSSCDF
jgi:hypothetical protein